MISADVKANGKHQELKEPVVLSYKFLWEVPSKLEIQCKKGIFQLILVGIPSSLILTVKNRGWVGWEGGLT